MSGHDVDSEAVTSRGWLVTHTDWDHVIELGLDIVGLNHPRTIFLDDRELRKMPIIFSGGSWQHAFTLDGRPAVLSASIVTIRAGALSRPAEAEFAYGLNVDGVDLGPPIVIERKPNRPAVGSQARRAPRRIVVAIAYAVAGLVAGSIVPAWETGTTGGGLLLVLMLAGALIVGLFTVPVAIVFALRGRLWPWARGVLWQLLPFDAGVIAGAAAAITVGVGSDDRATRALFSLLMIPTGIMTLALGGLGVVGTLRRRRRGDVSGGMFVGTLVAGIGMLGSGVGLVLIAIRLLGGDRYGIGFDGLLLVGGLVSLVVGGAVVIIERRWRRRSA